MRTPEECKTGVRFRTVPRSSRIPQARRRGPKRRLWITGISADRCRVFERDRRDIERSFGCANHEHSSLIAFGVVQTSESSTDVGVYLSRRFWKAGQVPSRMATMRRLIAGSSIAPLT